MRLLHLRPLGVGSKLVCAVVVGVETQKGKLMTLTTAVMVVLVVVLVQEILMLNQAVLVLPALQDKVLMEATLSCHQVNKVVAVVVPAKQETLMDKELVEMV